MYRTRVGIDTLRSMMMDIADVKALIFDVFGTVVDWRSSIIQHGKQFGRVHGVAAAWDAFADAWRAKYRPFMDKVRHGALPGPTWTSCTVWRWRKCSPNSVLPVSAKPPRRSSIWPGMPCDRGPMRCQVCIA